MKKTSFSLVELLITVTILGIISAIGVPVYSNYKESVLEDKVKTTLRLISSYQQDYKSTHGTYASKTNIPTTETSNSFMYDLNLKDKHFTYQIYLPSSSSSTQFQILAWDNKNATSYNSNLNKFVYVINQDGLICKMKKNGDNFPSLPPVSKKDESTNTNNNPYCSY